MFATGCRVKIGGKTQTEKIKSIIVAICEMLSSLVKIMMYDMLN